jgi:hypothetical protein
VVLLRKSIPQKTNLRTAAELGVIQQMANLMIFLLFLSTFGLVLFCCFSAYLGISSRSWPQTKGIILSSQLVERKNSASSSAQVYYHPLVIYEYAIDQKKYQSKRESSKLFATTKREHASKIISENPEGKEITVYYHPTFKKIACLNKGMFQITVHLLLFIAAFVPLITIVVGYILGNYSWLIESIFYLVSKAV